MRRWCDGGAGGWRRGWNALMVGRVYIPDAVAAAVMTKHLLFRLSGGISKTMPY